MPAKHTEIAGISSFLHSHIFYSWGLLNLIKMRRYVRWKVHFRKNIIKYLVKSYDHKTLLLSFHHKRKFIAKPRTKIVFCWSLLHKLVNLKLRIFYHLCNTANLATTVWPRRCCMCMSCDSSLRKRLWESLLISKDMNLCKSKAFMKTVSLHCM